MSPNVFKALCLSLPHTSRGVVLYAAQKLGLRFVVALRGDRTRVRYADRETRGAFADGVTDVVKNTSGKIKHEYDKLIVSLKKDKLDTDEVLTKISAASEKDTAAANEVKSWLKKKGASEETAEQAKNYANWVRLGDGKYKDVLVETISKAAQRMANILGMDVDDVEASMTSHYFIEVTAGGYKHLRESQSPSLYLELLRKHFSRRAPVYVREKQQRPSLDVEYEGDEDEDAVTPAAYVTEEDVGRYHDFDPDEPEAKHLLGNVEKFIMTKEPGHGRGIIVFLNELIKNRAWAQTSDIVQGDYELAKQLYDVNPNNDLSQFERETRGMTPEQKKKKITFSSQVYAYKVLYPRLVLAVTDYMKKHGKTTDLIMLKNALIAVRSSKFKDQSLEKLKKVPGYVLEEHPTESVEGERGTYRKYRKVSSGGTSMSELHFASANEALQHLANVIGQRVVVADVQRKREPVMWGPGEQKEGEATFKTKLVDEDGNKGPLLTVTYEWTAVKKDRFSPVRLVDLYVIGVQSAGQLKSITREDPETGEKERGYYRQLQLITKDLTKEEVERLELEATKDFTDSVLKKQFKFAAVVNDVIMRRLTMSELRFASADEALQHLADLIGKRVKVAAQRFTFNDELMEKTDLATFKKRLPAMSAEELDDMWDAFSNLLLNATGAEKALLTRKQEATNEEREARLTVEAEENSKTAKMKMNKKEVAKMLEYGISDFIDADDEHEVEEVTVTANDEVLIGFVDGTRFKVTVEQVTS